VRVRGGGVVRALLLRRAGVGDLCNGGLQRGAHCDAHRGQHVGRGKARASVHQRVKVEAAEHVGRRLDGDALDAAEALGLDGQAEGGGTGPLGGAGLVMLEAGGLLVGEQDLVVLHVRHLALHNHLGHVEGHGPGGEGGGGQRKGRGVQGQAPRGHRWTGGNGQGGGYVVGGTVVGQDGGRGPVADLLVCLQDELELLPLGLEAVDLLLELALPLLLVVNL